MANGFKEKSQVLQLEFKRYVETVKGGKAISKEDAKTMIEDYLDIQSDGYGVGYFNSVDGEFFKYHIFRFYYVSPGSSGYTTTVGRYWVNTTTSEIFEEDLQTGLIDDGFYKVKEDDR